MTRALICSLFCFFVARSIAQPFANPYPQGYFRWPVNLEPAIVANMGELRPNHWHMGLDVRTGGRENEPVMAAADGYIAHIGIRPSSFGRFIIINHPNGLSTLYGHLNTFAPNIERWVTEQQYKLESWAVELKPDSTQLRVNKGDFISYSGNTGGSQGPHVHFEIRTTSTDECLNPLLFGFDLPDAVNPTFSQLALYNRSISIYNSGRPKSFPVKRTDSGYIIPKLRVIETAMPVVSFGIRAGDRISGSSNLDGIYSAFMYLDGLPVSGFRLDSISYDETGYYNAHIDYHNQFSGGINYQLLSPLPNDRSGVYSKEGDGLIHLTDTVEHQVRIDISDVSGNTATLNFLLRLTDLPDMAVNETVGINTNNSAGANTIPGGTNATGTTGKPNAITPGVALTIARPAFELQLHPENIFDTIDLRYFSTGGPANAVSAAHSVNDESYPVQGLLKVRVQPTVAVNELQRNRIVIMRQARSTNYKKAEWEGNWMTAEFSDFGKYTAVADLTAPVINAPGRGDTINLTGSKRLAFTPTDASGIKSFRAEIDSQWIRFSNDKGRTWLYYFDERVPYGVHHLKVFAEDVAGNVTEREWWFKRFEYTAPPPKKKSKKGSKATRKTVTKKTATKKPAVKKKKK